MKIETDCMFNCENRNCSYGYLLKEKVQICLTMKIEIASLLNCENRSCKYDYLRK